MIRWLFALLGLTLWGATTAQAVTCERVVFDETQFSICTANASSETIGLFLKDADGKNIGQFTRLETILSAEGAVLKFAMNAGMYHNDRRPVGHYVENNKEHMRVIASPGPGNFGLLPNGVFCVENGRADVIETLAFQNDAPDCIHASQSGPMLVIDGELHPRFLIDSTSKYIRNGVGTSADGQTVVFAISDSPVTFHHFGRLYRDYLQLPQALYFDGKVSRIYAPDIGRADPGFSLGPIVAITAPKP